MAPTVADKRSYFRELYALREDPDPSQVEYDADTRAILRRPRIGEHESSTSTVMHLSGWEHHAPNASTVQVHRSFRTDESPPTPASQDAGILKETPFIPHLSKLHSARQQLRTPLTVAKKTHPAFARVEGAQTPSSTTSIVKETPLPPRISASLPSQLGTTPMLTDSSVVKETPLPQAINRPITKTIAAYAPSSGAPVLQYSSISSPISAFSMAGKRKRKEMAVKLKPDNELYLKGLIFYYIPPNDIALARRLRITKAREHGATWIRELATEVTHIIVDDTLNYQDVMKFLGLDTLPQGVVLVNEKYPIECCTRFKGLVPANQLRFRVTGDHMAIEPASEVEPPGGSQASAESLQLTKAAMRRNKGEHVTPNLTPPRRGDSTQRSPSIPLYEDVSGSILPSVLATSEVGGSVSEIPQRPLDELDGMFEMAKTLQHLPMDEDDDEDDDERHRETDDSGSETPRKLRKPRAKRNIATAKKPFSQANFSCMRGGTGGMSSTNANARTIEILQEMGDRYRVMGESWRERAYRRAVGTLRRVPTQVCTYEEAVALQHIGTRLARKIEEIVRTDSLRRLESAKAEPVDLVLQLFSSIYGVGNSQAWRWIQQGYKTLEDLKTKATLTKNQQLGIKHYDDLLTRVPREEVSELAGIVIEAASALDPDIKVIVGGSYRRGASTSGDLDCLLTKSGTTSSDELLPFLSDLVHTLETQKFLVAALATPHTPHSRRSSRSESGSSSGSKWHGCCVLPSSPKKIWRRIDFLVVPGSQLGAALIYFTGDDIFNRSMRLLASNKGMRLNQRGLYGNVMRGEGRVKVTDGQLIEGEDEVAIFEKLGVPWRPPRERILS
ncbi:DNA polymerase lambda [Phlyctema vagabunda]|uniref:DNA-directed DNA polymerase n=1 Tax=Phlyctema vagabunda TaxID=108571 RepID=A0ABR4PXG1_9HELO